MSTNIIQLSPHFTVKEFKCHDGTDVPVVLLPYAQKLAEQLEIIRSVDDYWISILSAYRTDKYNKKVGGRKNSFHLMCMAADIVKPHIRVTELFQQILHLIQHEVIIDGGLGIYDTFIHYDIRSTPARWDERTT
ncbi:MAG: D-Ala-D-Ala carboxypeptidase family metallohydrolase [Segetibacter sp.]